MATLKQKQARSTRVRKRIAFRFGAKGQITGSGFTTNVSARGLGVASHAIHPKGTKLSLELTLPGGDRCHVECVVAWAQQGVAQFRAPGSMGLRVTQADEVFFQYIAHVMGAEVLPPVVSRPSPGVKVIARVTPAAVEAAPMVEAVAHVAVPAAAPVAPVDLRAVLPDFLPPARTEWFEAPEATAAESTPTPEPIASTPMPERAPRLVEQLPVRCGLGEELTGRGFTLNLSRTGLAILTTLPLKPHEQVNIAITMPDGMFSSGTGSVVWARPQSFGTGRHIIAGVQLNYVDISYDELLDTLSRTVSPTPAV